MPAHDLRTAPPPPLREDDHVRGDPGGALIVLYADFTCPRCALAHERLADAGEAARMKAFWRERLATLKELLEQRA